MSLDLILTKLQVSTFRPPECRRCPPLRASMDGYCNMGMGHITLDGWVVPTTPAKRKCCLLRKASARDEHTRGVAVESRLALFIAF